MTSSLGSDLSIDNVVRLGSTDTKIDSQGAAKKALELMEKWKYPKLRGKFNFFFKNLLETWLTITIARHSLL